MPTVDVHTHFYPPVRSICSLQKPSITDRNAKSFITLLQSRNTIPYILNHPSTNTPSRLIILPSEDANKSTSRGRPIGPAYYRLESKLTFMRDHNIDISVLSLANPWLDWVSPAEAATTARQVNDEMEYLCSTPDAEGKLFAFATLPLSGTEAEVVDEVHRVAALPHVRGIVMGTGGFGSAGLDDPRLDAVWTALEKTETVAFLHPHYGLPGEVYGPRAEASGHVLPLALGFPLETTIAVTRMFLAGVWDRFPALKVLIAHSGGTLPFLAGRIESCILHDAHLMEKWKGSEAHRRDVWDVLKRNVYLDAVIYGNLGLKAAVEASGSDRVMFGTDHPFFPPLDSDDKEWLSVSLNSQAVKTAFGDEPAVADAIMGGNAIRALRLTT